MKVSLTFISFLVGLAAATSPFDWQPGKEYQFEYSGRVLTGMPKLNSHFSGLAINATVSLFVKDASQFYLGVKNPKFVAMNQQMQLQKGRSFDEGNEMRRVRLPEMSPVPEQHKAALERPVSFNLREDGSIKDCQIEQEDPLWSRNFKKALVNLFQGQLQSEALRNWENMIESPASEEFPFWTVKEQSIIGECETSYQVNKLPDYVVLEEPSLVPRPSACQGKEYFEVVRTINFDKCDRVSMYQFFGAGELGKCSSKTQSNCESLHGRSSSVRYIACGSRAPGQLSVQTIISDGQMSSMLLAHRTEMMITGTHQNLTLVEVKPVSSYPQPSNPVRLDLMYDFASISQKPSYEGRIPKQSQTPEAMAQSDPSNFLAGLSGNSHAEIPGAGEKIVNIIQDLVKDIHEMSGHQYSEAQFGVKLLTAARGFSMIKSSDEILKLYNNLQSSDQKTKETAQQLFADACAISGTPQAVEFFEKAYSGGHLEQNQMMNFFLWMTHNVRIPNEKVLKRLYQTITSDAIKSKPQMYNIAITGFTQLVQQACVIPERSVKYPAQVYGEFCHPDSAIVQEMLIPYLSMESRKSGASENYKNIHIIALGLLSHKNVIGELTPLAEQSEGQDASAHRILALYSLANAGFPHPDLVIPIFQALFVNPSESTEVRTIAFNNLLKLNPPTHVFTTIALTTHQEPLMDYELLKTINIALYTLGHSIPTVKLPAEQIQLVRKCKDAYAIVKKTYGITTSSGTYYKTEFLKEFGVGYQGFLTWIASQESVLPKSVFAKVNIFLEAVSFNLIEAGYRLNGVESIYERVSDDLHSGSESLMEKVQKQLSSEWKSVIEKLKLESRQPSKFESLVYLRGLRSGVFLSSFSDSSSEYLKEKIVEMIRNPSFSSINDQMRVNLQKSNLINNMVFSVPNEMGFPINTQFYTPVTASLVGNMKINSVKSNPSVSVDTKMLYTAQMTGWVGTMVPFTEEYALTGIDQHMLVSVPGSMKVDVSIPDQKVSVTIKPGSEQSSGGQSDMLHYHALPYTVKESIKSLVPHTKSQNLKLIRSTAPSKSGQYQFGQSLGLSMNARYKTESEFTDFNALLETFRLYNYNPINMLIFPYTPPAFDTWQRLSTRHQSFTVSLSPERSSTKEIHMEFKVGYASKHNGQNAMYHSIKTVSGTERLSSQEHYAAPSILSLVKKVVPYRVHSEFIKSVSHHPNRAEKLRSTMDEMGPTNSNQALSIFSKVMFRGSSPKSYSYSLSLAKGQQPKETKVVEQKWNLKFESSDNSESSSFPKKVCINGQLDLPLLPMWNIHHLREALTEFAYQNKISFGQNSCSESTINSHGKAEVSDKQNTHSLTTPEAKECIKLTQKQEKGSQLSEVCQRARDQASTLDLVEINSEYKNVPNYVQHMRRTYLSFLKAFLWPYYNPYSKEGSGSQDQSSYRTKTLLAFKQKSPSFDLTISGPNGEVKFYNIHIHQPYSLFFPFRAGMSCMNFDRKVSGSTIYPTCKVDAKTITTYNNQTLPNCSDKCFHLLTADCSQHKRFGVSFRNVEGDKKEVKVFLMNKVVLLTPSGSEGPKVSVDGESISVHPNQETEIKQQGKVIATLTRSVDGVIVLKSPTVYLAELAFNGKLISVSPSPMLKNRLCGLCGNYNHRKSGDVVGPSKCVYSKSELKVAAYRIPSESCPPMSALVESELRKETDQCSKYHILSSKVAQGYKMNTGKCTLLRHAVLQHSKKVCVSKVPITQCGPSCKTDPSQLVKKNVPFVCFPNGHEADQYVRKAKEGETFDTLETMTTSYETEIEQPRHCVHALVSRSTPSY